MNGNSLLLQASVVVQEGLQLQEWAPDNVTMAAFFKCTRWQEEYLTDAATACRYHYFCDATYRGDYPRPVGSFVFFFTVACYLITSFFTVVHVKEGGSRPVRSRRRCLLASGPIILPVIVLVLSNAHRIMATAIFPLSATGPVLLQLVHVSALAFKNKAERCVRYALLESSTASGILHASLYLDSVMLPYHTGLDALVRSTFSGECGTCICREEPLVVGGKLVSYRAWSATTFCVVTTLCSRMTCVVLGASDGVCSWVKLTAEGMAWILVSKDTVQLMVASFRFVGSHDLAAHGAVAALIGLHVVRKAVDLVCFFVDTSRRTTQHKTNSTRHNDV